MKRATMIAIVCGLLLSGCAAPTEVMEETSERAEVTTEIATEITTAEITTEKVTEAPPVETEKVFTVKFDSQGGSQVSSRTVKFCEKVKEPVAPTRKCCSGCWCKFVGWYYGDEEWSFIGYVVTEDMTLTAKWEECYGLSKKQLEYAKYHIWKYYGWEWEEIEVFQLANDYESHYRCLVRSRRSEYIDHTFTIPKNDADIVIPKEWENK